jgi:hypothetical protein
MFIDFNHDQMACFTFFQDMFDGLFSPYKIDEVRQCEGGVKLFLAVPSKLKYHVCPKV